MRGLRIEILIASLALFVAGSASAADGVEDKDHYDFVVHGETYAELFQRSLLPGPNGSLVSTDTVVPVQQYFTLSVHDIDTSWRKDSIDAELSAWGQSFFGERETERRFDGDVQSANIRYTHGPVSLRLGRQHVAGGAARYVRFDGVTLNGELESIGLDAVLYAGYTVLPRWNQRPGYHHLGAAADSLLRDPDALPEPERSGYRLAGGRLGWSSTRANAGVSFHEQHEPGGLSRRTLGADGRVDVFEETAVGGAALMELDAERLQDARVWVDTTPVRPLDLSVEYLHTEPSLFLSRQSVLSVFTTDTFDEAGGTAVLTPVERFSLEGSGFVELYSDGEQGARGEIAARVQPGSGKKTLVRVGYGRVVAVDNGYHSLRASISRRFLPPLTGTVEAYAYLYDEPILGHTTSTIYAGTLGYQATDALNLLWGASVAQSPYARLDAQTLVRASYDFDFSHRGAGN